MALSMEQAALLSTALQSRAVSVAELAALAFLDEASVRAQLGVLQAEGYLAVDDGDKIVYRSPDDAIADLVRDRAHAMTHDLTERLENLADLVGALPRLMRAQAVGEAEMQLLELEVFHGPRAVVEFWHHLHARTPFRRTDVLLPEASRLHTATPELQKVWHEAGNGDGRRSRVIGTIADATNPVMQTRISQEIAGGVQLRVVHSLPSWMIVADETVALPVIWGERWPTSVLAITSPAAAGLARWTFERLWDGAIPVRAQSDSWESLLALMRTGATLEQASAQLGISDRTGRRRINQAMDRFGVSSLFALGVAWGQQHPE